jgi:hypothetical protein
LAAVFAGDRFARATLGFSRTAFPSAGLARGAIGFYSPWDNQLGTLGEVVRSGKGELKLNRT